jgi:hypothetical protein
MIIRKYKISPAGRYDKVSLRHYTRRASNNEALGRKMVFGTFL